MKEDIRRILLSPEQIAGRVAELGAQISRDYENGNLLMICILKGSAVFLADLMRAVTVKCEIDFMCVSSYGKSTKTTGVVNIIKDLGVTSPEDYDLLIVEDIVDSGRTLFCLRELLLARNPKSVKLCTLLDKPERRETDVKSDYFGFTIPDEFVVGYGLDYGEKYRNLPYIGVLKPEIYRER